VIKPDELSNGTRIRLDAETAGVGLAQDAQRVAHDVDRHVDAGDELGAVQDAVVVAVVLTGVSLSGATGGEQERTSGQDTDAQSFANPSLHAEELPFEMFDEWRVQLAVERFCIRAQSCPGGVFLP